MNHFKGRHFQKDIILVASRWLLFQIQSQLS